MAGPWLSSWVIAKLQQGLGCTRRGFCHRQRRCKAWLVGQRERFEACSFNMFLTITLWLGIMHHFSCFLLVANKYHFLLYLGAFGTSSGWKVTIHYHSLKLVSSPQGPASTSKRRHSFSDTPRPKKDRRRWCLC